MATTPEPDRLGLAIAVLLGLWALSWILFVVGLLWPLGEFDSGGSGDGAASVALYSASAVVFLLSGPAAHRVARRRWLLVAPAILGVVWLASVMAAAAT